MNYTIVIPYRNRAAYLPSTLASLPIGVPLVLVDNGSTDQSADICREFAATRPHVRCISHEGGGASAARNAGLAEVRTEWVYFFDSDDLFCAPTPFFQWDGVPTCDNLDVVCLRTMMERSDESGTRLKARAYRPTASPLHQILVTMLATQSMILRTAWLRSIGGWDESLPVWEDWELGLRVLLRQPRLCWADTAHAYHRIRLHGDSLTGSNFSDRAPARFAALKVAEQLVATLAGPAEQPRLHRALDLRRGILCGLLLREGYPLGAERPHTFPARCLMHLVKWGLRGAWRIALWLA